MDGSHDTYASAFDPSLARAVLTWYLVAIVTGLPGWLPDPVVRFLDRLPGLHPSAPPS